MENDGVRFYDAVEDEKRALAKILVRDGSLAALDVAQEDFFEYLHMPLKTIREYGLMVGAMEWMVYPDEQPSS